jgi:very-short-patch-repair endonuclease
VVEVDGGQHCENEEDVERTAYLCSQGFEVIRFWNNDVLQNLEGVLQTIAAAASGCPPPSPSREREGVI